MKRSLQRLKYRLGRLVLRSALYQILVAALLLLVVMVGGGVTVYVWTDEFPTLRQALWWAWLRLSDPGYLGQDFGRLTRMVSLLLTISGLLFYTGAVVAILTNLLANILAGLSSGSHRVVERDHLLIIGWPAGIGAVVTEALRAWQRLDDDAPRALPPVVILLEPEQSASLRKLELGLREALPPDLRRRAQLLLRTGDPRQPETLRRLDAANAAAILLLPVGQGAAPRRASDMRMIQTLQALRGLAGAPGRPRPPTVTIELSVSANRALALAAGPARTQVIAHADVLSYIFAEAVRRPGFAQVAASLAEPGRGAVVVGRAAALGATGRTLRALVPALTTAIPVGVVSADDDAARLLDLDTPLGPDDRIVGLGPSAAALAAGYAPERVGAWDEDDTAPPAPPAASAEPSRPRRALVIGRSYLLRALGAHLNAHPPERFELTLVHSGEVELVQAYLAQLAGRLDRLTVTARLARLTGLDELAELRPQDYDIVLVLVPELAEDPRQPDADAVMNAHLVDRTLQELAPDHATEVVAELYDAGRVTLLPPSVAARALVTPALITHLMVQAALLPVAASVYAQLLTPEGPDLELRPLPEAAGALPGAEVDFDLCQRACLAAGALALGYLLEGPRGALDAGVHINPTRALRFRPGPGDRLVVLVP